MGLVPSAFVDFDHPTGVAADAAVGKEVRGVREYQIESTVQVVCHRIHEFQAVPLVQPYAGGAVLEDAAALAGDGLPKA